MNEELDLEYTHEFSKMNKDIDTGKWGICPICESPAPTIYIENRKEAIEHVAILNFAARILAAVEDESRFRIPTGDYVDLASILAVIREEAAK